jgi:hypothetical protein
MHLIVFMGGILLGFSFAIVLISLLLASKDNYHAYKTRK